jgi:ElaB/YqjD/DUF883 family membrane-anchored ribosome-binding protein
VDNELEVIRGQMEEKRASLAEKLDAVENLVVGTVQEATAEVSNIVHEVKSTVGAVTDDVKSTVGTVKESVQQTVATVAETLDLRDHIRRYPWIAMGSAVAVGFGGAYLLGPGRPIRRYLVGGPPPPERIAPRRLQTNGFHGAAAVSAPEPSAKPEEPSPLVTAGKEAMKTLEELALGTLMGVVREMVTPNLPETLRRDVSTMFDDFTNRIGGKVLPENFLGADRYRNYEGEEHEHGNEAEMGRPVGSAQRQDQEPLGQPDGRRAEADRRRL